MLRPKTPASVRLWARSPPGWVEVHAVIPDAALTSSELDAGELEAIALALNLKASVLIIDETIGRRQAQELGLRVIGTLGILRDADALGLLDMRQVL